MSMSDHDHADPAPTSDHGSLPVSDHVDPIIPSSGLLIASPDMSIRVTCPPPKLPNNCVNFEDLEQLLTVYQDTTFQNLSIKRCTTISSSNECIKAIERKRPDSFNLKYKFIQFCCIHGAAIRRDQAGNNKKTRMRSSYYIRCPFLMLITVPFNEPNPVYDGFYVHSFNGAHNHPVNPVVYSQYPRQRSLPEHDQVLQHLVNAQVNNRLIKKDVHETHDLRVSLRDIYNFKALQKLEALSELSTEQRVESSLSKLPKGSHCHILYDEKLEIEAICFHMPHMQKLFSSHGEILCIDTTFSVRTESYALLSLMITDPNGHGRPVYFAIISSETEEILGRMFKNFSELNPVSMVKVVVVDKDFTEIKTVKAAIPSVAVKICEFHAI